MTPLPFVKASACGNDFLIIDSALAPADIHTFTRAICDRHQGVGADGVEWVTAGGGDHDVSARLINSDGSDAEISGNGTRCVAAWWIAKHAGKEVRVGTGAGVKRCRLVRRQASAYFFETAMGSPRVLGKLQVAGVEGVQIDLGNPHFVVLVDDFDFDWRSQAQRVQADKRFPHGTNVELASVTSAHEIAARFYERGAGETSSSGTGSCAAAVAAIDSKQAQSPVTVIAPGGPQTVRWERELFLEGPARIICAGEYFYES